MAISLDDLRALLLDRRDAVLAAVRDVLLRGDPDPFAMSYDDGLALSEEERIALTRRAHALREDLLEREFRERGATWIIMAGDDIVASGPDIEGCPDDPSLAEVGRRTGRFPFLFTRILVEDEASRAPWASLGRGDAYPTLATYFGRPGADDELFAGAVTVADLDTGSPAVFAPWEVGLNEGWSPTSMVWRKDRHLGMDYEWRPCRAVVGVVDAAGGRRRAEMTVIAVRNWAGGPFVRVNANRRALVGRNLLMALGLRVLLLADSRETDVTRP
jgi:hypothetical protein